MRIDIEALTDSHECEICGMTYAEGFAVKKDFEDWFRLEPVADCMGGESYTEIDLLREVLSRLHPGEQVAVNIEY